MQSCFEILKVKSLEDKITLVFQKQMLVIFLCSLLSPAEKYFVGNYSRVMFSSGQLFVVDVFLWVIINAECFYLTIIKIMFSSLQLSEANVAAAAAISRTSPCTLVSRSSIRGVRGRGCPEILTFLSSHCAIHRPSVQFFDLN